MYLYKRGFDPEGDDVTYEITKSAELVAYWRKANQIHAWFVDNVQNGEDECKPHEVNRLHLVELVDRCKRVLADHELAPELLPSRSGFFFGSYDYDYGYFEDLEDTVKQLEPLIDSGELYFTYQSSW